MLLFIEHHLNLGKQKKGEPGRRPPFRAQAFAFWRADVAASARKPYPELPTGPCPLEGICFSYTIGSEYCFATVECVHQLGHLAAGIRTHPHQTSQHKDIVPQLPFWVNV